MNRTANAIIENLSDILRFINDDLNKLQTLAVRSKNTQQRLVSLFSDVSEIIQNAELKEVDADKIVEQYIGIAQEHEFSAETFTEMSETVLTFLSYVNIMFGYLLAGKDMIKDESAYKRSKRQCRKRVGGATQKERLRMRHNLK